MKLYIFDTMNMFHRAFWGNDKLSTSDGFPTQALHGFVRMVNGIVRDHKPDLIAFAMEGGGPNPRKLAEPLYKSNRQESPEDLKLQLKALPELLSALNYPTFKVESYEADDVIATLARLGRMAGMEVVIVSSDKDFCQLISEKVHMYNISKEQMVSPGDVYLRYGVSPEQFLDYLSIVGDSSDNIKGVQGIGPKGASELISTFGSLDGIYANLATIKGSKKDKLIASREDVYKAKSLISFMVAPLGDIDISKSCAYNGVNKDALRTLFRKYEFRELESMMLGADVVNMSGVEIGVRK